MLFHAWTYPFMSSKAQSSSWDSPFRMIYFCKRRFSSNHLCCEIYVLYTRGTLHFATFWHSCGFIIKIIFSYMLNILEHWISFFLLKLYLKRTPPSNTEPVFVDVYGHLSIDSRNRVYMKNWFWRGHGTWAFRFHTYFLIDSRNRFFTP